MSPGEILEIVSELYPHGEWRLEGENEGWVLQGLWANLRVRPSGQGVWLEEEWVEPVGRLPARILARLQPPRPPFVVILAHARSASSTLQGVLEVLGWHLACEPFRAHKLGGYGLVATDPSLRNLRRLEHRYDGVKTLVHQLSESENRTLLQSGSRSLFLYRENFLAAAISAGLCRAVGYWGSDSTRMENFRGELALAEVERDLLQLRHSVEQYRDVAGLSLSTEQLLQGDGLERVCNYLEVAEPRSPARELLQLLLGPHFKVNQPAVWRRIENLDEIRSRFGEFGSFPERS